MWKYRIGFGARALLVSGLFLAACGPSNQPASSGSQSSAQPTAAAAGQSQPAASSGGNLIFFSNQFKPVEEQGKMQDVILKDAPVKVEYIPEDPGPFNDRLNAEQKANKVTVSLIGGLHGDLEPFMRAGYLEDLTPLAQKLGDRGISQGFADLAHMGTKDKT